MSTNPKPPVTGETHPLPFEKLAPLAFERLCLWLVDREGYERSEALGQSGRERGRDVRAWRGDRHFVFQCKRVKRFSAADGKKEIVKLRRKLSITEQPHELVFVVCAEVSADARAAIREEWGEEATCHFWVGVELDRRVKRHPEIVLEFFQLPPESPAHLLSPEPLAGPALGRIESTQKSKPSVFVSYCYHDRAWKDRIVLQLKVLERAGLLDIWEDSRIPTGSEWLPEIEAAIKHAHVAVLLVSAHFLQSRFIREKEVPDLLARRRAEGLLVFPVIIRHCAWDQVEELASIQARPRNGKVLADFRGSRADREIVEIAREIHSLTQGTT